MKKCLNQLFLLIIFLMPNDKLFSQEDKSISIDSLMKTVVYLQDEKPLIKQINDKVYEIGIREIGKKDFELQTVTVYGTGFFVNKQSNLFLVTAGHVAKDLNYNSSLITSDKDGNAIQYSLNKKLNWKFNDYADVAVSIISDMNLISLFQPYAIDFQFFPDSLTFPAAEFPLVVLGFPLQYGIKGKFSPLRRETNSASALIDLPRADTKQIATFFIVQDPSIGGYSGAPVFIIDAHSFGNTIIKGFNAIMCIGIMHGTSMDNTGGKLGLVVPSKYVYDLIK